MYATCFTLCCQVREVVHDFYNSRYATCFSQLEALRPVIAVDIHLHDHAAALYREIRTKALVQYCAPFSSVDLTKMAAAFNSSVRWAATVAWILQRCSVRMACASVVACSFWPPSHPLAWPCAYATRAGLVQVYLPGAFGRPAY